MSTIAAQSEDGHQATIKTDISSTPLNIELMDAPPDMFSPYCAFTNDSVFSTLDSTTETIEPVSTKNINATQLNKDPVVATSTITDPLFPSAPNNNSNTSCPVITKDSIASFVTKEMSSSIFKSNNSTTIASTSATTSKQQSKPTISTSSSTGKSKLDNLFSGSEFSSFIADFKLGSTSSTLFGSPVTSSPPKPVPSSKPVENVKQKSIDEKHDQKFFNGDETSSVAITETSVVMESNTSFNLSSNEPIKVDTNNQQGDSSTADKYDDEGPFRKFNFVKLKVQSSNFDWSSPADDSEESSNNKATDVQSEKDPQQETPPAIAESQQEEEQQHQEESLIEIDKTETTEVVPEYSWSDSQAEQVEWQDESQSAKIGKSNH